eukprot:Opistho-2@17652
MPKRPLPGDDLNVNPPKRSAVVGLGGAGGGGSHKSRFLELDAFSRHKKLVNDYISYYGGSLKDFAAPGTAAANVKTDYDVLVEQHKFLWDDEDDRPSSWEKRIAKNYYDKLFKEYCIADLSRYDKGQIALRWRTEAEVVEGKGQFICGARKCGTVSGLESWEVNFNYVEHGETKAALVKVRLCPGCSRKLNYRHEKKRAVSGDTRSAAESRSAEDGRSEEGEHGDLPKGEERDLRKDVVEEGDEVAPRDVNVWRQPAASAEKSRADEFDEYLEGMFL